MHLTKWELCIVSALALMAWSVAEFLPQSKLITQIIAGFQSASYMVISSSFLIKNGFFRSSWPYAIYGSVWFLFLDLMIGNYTAPEQYAVKAGFAATLFGCHCFCIFASSTSESGTGLPSNFSILVFRFGTD
jgi:hypothetical protein